VQTIRGPDDFAAAFDAPPETIERLVLYEQLLRHWQKAVNLVAPGTLDDVWHRHFADCAQLVALAPPAARSWVDLGSGAGFPGLVAAIVMAGGRQGWGEGQQPRLPPSPRASPTSPRAPSARGEGWGEGQPQAAPSVRPTIRFTLIESDTRKCAFLREVVRRTGIIQAGITVDILSKRAESARTSVNEDLPRVVSARALAPLDRLLELAAPLSPPGTTLLFLKGKEAEREVQLAERRWQFQVALVPSVTDRHGRIAVITNLERKAKD
jgi:16S rRNA (guanine527-N7)-methyltransferase